MKPEAQRIAIGEYCHDHSQDRFTHWTDGDYLTDLNVMHGAEKVLTMEQASRYGHNLIAATGRSIELNEDTQIGGLDVFAIACLTAAQRAEAFLRTIGKWEE